jgi:hypothetical protein
LRSQKERDHSEDLSVDARIILNGSRGNRVGRCGLNAHDSGQCLVMSFYYHGNEPSSSIKVVKFLD